MEMTRDLIKEKLRRADKTGAVTIDANDFHSAQQHDRVIAITSFIVAAMSGGFGLRLHDVDGSSSSILFLVAGTSFTIFVTILVDGLRNEADRIKLYLRNEQLQADIVASSVALSSARARSQELVNSFGSNAHLRTMGFLLGIDVGVLGVGMTNDVTDEVLFRANLFGVPRLVQSIPESARSLSLIRKYKIIRNAVELRWGPRYSGAFELGFHCTFILEAAVDQHLNVEGFVGSYDDWTSVFRSALSAYGTDKDLESLVIDAISFAYETRNAPGICVAIGTIVLLAFDDFAEVDNELRSKVNALRREFIRLDKVDCQLKCALLDALKLVMLERDSEWFYLHELVKTASA